MTLLTRLKKRLLSSTTLNINRFFIWRIKYTFKRVKILKVIILKYLNLLGYNVKYLGYL